jgi:hypothetical protein
MRRQILTVVSLVLGAAVGLWAQSSVVLDGAGSKLELKNNAELQLSGSAGTADQLLVSQGSGATPTWKSLSGAAGEITITSSATALTVGLANTGVSAGTYGSATQVPQITVDAKGRVTSVTNVTISGVSPGGPAGGDLSGTYPNPTVSGLCTKPLDCTAIGGLTGTDRKVLTWNGAQWTPWGIVGDGTTTTVTAAMGNFTVSANNTSAIWNANQLQGNAVAAGTLGAGDAGKVLLWNGSAWTGTALSGDIASVSGTGAVALAATGVSAGTYGSATQVPQITVDAKGRITSATNVAISGVPPGGPAGGDLSGNYPNPTVAKIQGNAVAAGALGAGDAGKVLLWNGSTWTGTALSGDIASVSGTGAVALATTGVSAGTYGSATQVPVITVDAKGRITSATNVAISGVPPGGPAGGDLSGNYPNPTVARIQGNAVAPGTLGPGDDGKVLKWDGATLQWTPAFLTASGPAGGDLSGTYPNPTVSGLCGTPLNCAAISGLTGADRKVLTWNGTQWTPWGIVGDGTTTTVTAAMGNFTVSANNTSAIWNANKLQGNAVAAGTLGAGDAGKVLQWDGSQWTAAGIGAAGGWAVGGNALTSDGSLGTTTNYAVIFITNNTEAMRLTTNQRLDFQGGAGAYRIDLPNNTNIAIGKIRANGFATYSSLRWKEDIRPIGNALERVMALRGVNFRWKPEYGGGEDIGFIMEEVDRVVPEVVQRDERTGELLGMDYSRLTALLVEALKQHVRTQEQVNAQLQQENAELRQRVERLESLVEQLLRQNGERGTSSQPSTIQDAWLGQNIPNPFAGTTTIPYYVPAGVSRAELVVRDVGGRELKRLELAERGGARAGGLGDGAAGFGDV